MINTFVTFLLLVLTMAACAAPPAPQTDPKKAAELQKKAVQLTFDRNFPAAVDTFSEAIRHAPDNKDLYRLKAETLDAMLRYDEAAETFAAALEHMAINDPDRDVVAYRIGLALAASDRGTSRAKRQLGEVSDPARNADLEGFIAMQAGDPSTALLLFNRALQQASERELRARIHYHAAMAHHALGNITEANRELFDAVNLAGSLALKQQIRVFFVQLQTGQ